MLALVLDDAVLGKEDTILAGGARAEHVHEDVLGGVKTHVVNPLHVGVADDDVLLPREVVDTMYRSPMRGWRSLNSCTFGAKMALMRATSVARSRAMRPRMMLVAFCIVVCVFDC